MNRKFSDGFDLGFCYVFHQNPARNEEHAPRHSRPVAVVHAAAVLVVCG